MCGANRLSLLLLVISLGAQGQIDTEYEDCGKTKECFELPENCIATFDCKVLVSYIVNEEDKVEFTLSAYLSNGEYGAIALSEYPKMENNSVMACWVNSSGDQQDVFGSWNNYHNNVKLDNPSEGLLTKSNEYSDMVLKCTFTRDTETVITPPGSETEFIFNLKNDSFFILLAYGPMSGDSINYHTEKSISSEKINLFNPISIDDDYDGCGTTKGCFGLPPDCLGTKDCDALVSYMVNEDDKVQFSLTLSASVNGRQYAAIGLSESLSMENSSVMACWSDAADVPQDVFESWNYDYSNSKLENQTAGLVMISKQFSNGVLQCTFTRETDTIISPPGLDTDFPFNLEDDSFFLLLSYGPMTMGDDAQLSYHLNRYITPERVNLFDPLDTTTTTSTTTSPSEMSTTTSASSTTNTIPGSTSTLSPDLCFVPGEVYGLLIGVVPVSSYGACLEECRGLSGCLWFTEYYEESLCGMFETMTDIHDDDCPSCISGNYHLLLLDWFFHCAHHQ